MSVLFVSHASRDDALVGGLVAWLDQNGFRDHFADHLGIGAGEKWEDALQAAAGACRVVVCLVTENWLASTECFAEFRAAAYMGKRLAPLLLVDPAAPRDQVAADRLRRVLAEDQGVDLRACLGANGLDLSHDAAAAASLADGLRLAGALSSVGLDPRAFAIDRSLRPTPFPGLAAFGDDDADAALFFGRSREIAQTLEELRKMRATRDRRPLVILGASGAGKSSLLRAGVIPRLRRETPAWLPLRAFRPGGDPLLNFAEAITRTLEDFGAAEAHGVLRRNMMAAWRDAERDAQGALTETGRQALVDAFEQIGAFLRRSANRPEATILISVDQAEEIARSEGESGEALGDYLRAATAAKSEWLLALTIRTDSFPELQSHRRFRSIEANGYDLRALPVFRFNDVVEAPAERYGVRVDAALVDTLMEDAPKEDALPLLAFALQRLWRQFAADGALTLTDYRDTGGLTGLIEDAAERALCGLEPEQDAPRPANPPKPALALAAETFVPPLAQINDQGAAIRRVADWAGFGEAAQALLARFDRWRLVVRRASEGGADSGDGGTVEVAHESLFREWARLRDWLEPERARLEALRGVGVAASAWARSGRSREFLTHFGQRLAEAEALPPLPRYAQRLDETDRAYLAACRRTERAATRRRRVLQTTAGLLGVGIVLGSVSYAFEFEIRREWARRTQVAPFVKDDQELAALEDLAAFRECGDGFACPEMVVLPGGAFTMGSPEDEPGRYGDEGPQHEVRIQRFAASKFEITHDDWAACVAFTKPAAHGADEPPGGGCAPIGDSGYGTGSRPAINVSWEDAQGYVAWLNQMVARSSGPGPYRLLTEAEWEYAARAGADGAYYWGDDPVDLCRNANVMDPDTKRKYTNAQGEPAACENNFVETAPVGSFGANAFGLHDVSGNVWEWVEDCWHPGYAGAPEDGSAWMESDDGDCSLAVLRGGSWSLGPQYARSAYRFGLPRVNRSDSVGFRVARMLPL